MVVARRTALRATEPAGAGAAVCEWASGDDRGRIRGRAAGSRGERRAHSGRGGTTEAAATTRPDPETELKLLALGALRLDDLEGRALAAFAGDPLESDLGPRWFRERLDRSRSQPLRQFGEELAEELVRRAWRVAFSKMELRADGTLWFPSRIRHLYRSWNFWLSPWRTSSSTVRSASSVA